MYEQTDSAVMGSPLGPLIGKVFKHHLAHSGMVPSLNKRHVDDTPARIPNTDAADFLNTLNSLYLSMKFTMELPADNMIPCMYWK